ncbi:cytochrome b [Frigidibacter sp. ROC022]|uniref:cytochrome b n=1 Tax=Frigidibacter sp. ROC022 TaxID=2971796 RepID=UPI00215A73B4|nr:cytochrome b/b6 domain-containing protein [Frigidibacter sp. ROC022]MCR8725848.1 cytochrome b/b6 domain-containing protein [Frigidibacter sp. ROC022]
MTPQGYSRLQIVLHWLTAALLLVSFFSHEGMKASWRALSRGTEMTVTTGTMLHVWVGISILALTVLRLAVRLTRGAPAAPEGGSKLLELLARWAHWALYSVLLAIPFSGAMAWFVGVKQAAGTHEILFTIGWILVALHTAAALFHQLVLKDNLMQRMKRPG